MLRQHNITKDEITWFANNVCPPSIVGLNYYLTSDRFRMTVSTFTIQVLEAVTMATSR